MYKVLITNDDGIFSIGLKSLLGKIKHIGKPIVVVPNKEQSAASHSLTLLDPIRARKISDSVYVVNGTPADCVRFGIIEICKNKIDLVISGINCGPNLGYDVTYSGTVAAAREGTLMNIPSFAVSLVNRTGRNFKTAAVIAQKLARFILEKRSLYKMNGKTFFNVNVPDLPLKKINGIRITQLGRRKYENKIHTSYDPYGLPYYWLKSKLIQVRQEHVDTDTAVIKKNMVAITPLTVDITDFSSINSLKIRRLEDLRL